jgi:pimeloyl-ACP methyl ester carboxylesterase
VRIVLIPGWNEGAGAMSVFIEGRHGIAGLAAAGYGCSIFGSGRGSMMERVDQLAGYLEGLRAGGDPDEPVALFGYSAGGLVARGLLRKYPDCNVAAVFQLGTPNAGIESNGYAGFVRRFHFTQSELADLDLESDFMRWLNGTSGKWVGDGAAKRWKLDGKPWLAPAKTPVYNMVGRMPRYHRSGDGVVRVESATLDGLLTHECLEHNGANHLNLSGAWNALTLALRGWRSDDRVWPKAVERASAFFAEAQR